MDVSELPWCTDSGKQQLAVQNTYIFKPRNEIHNLQTRNAHKLNLIRVKNNYGFKYKGAKMYNELPYDIMYCKSLNIFKNRTKYYKSFY